MKRGRTDSRAARALSGASESGLITAEQKTWLRAVLSDGDEAVEAAVDALAQGNASPLRILVQSSANSALRARLETLSVDGRLRSFGSFADDGSTYPSVSKLDDLAADLRRSSIAERSSVAVAGFDLEAMLDDLGEMIGPSASAGRGSAQPSTSSFDALLGEDGYFAASSSGEGGAMSAGFFGAEDDFAGGGDGGGGISEGGEFGDTHSRTSSRSMISDSAHSEAPSDPSSRSHSGRFGLSSGGALLLAQARAREGEGYQAAPTGSSITGSSSGGLGSHIIDDYFHDPENSRSSAGGGRGGGDGDMGLDGGFAEDYGSNEMFEHVVQEDLDALERSMLNILAEDSAVGSDVNYGVAEQGNSRPSGASSSSSSSSSSNLRVNIPAARPKRNSSGSSGGGSGGFSVGTPPPNSPSGRAARKPAVSRRKPGTQSPPRGRAPAPTTTAAVAAAALSSPLAVGTPVGPLPPPAGSTRSGAAATSQSWSASGSSARGRADGSSGMAGSSSGRGRGNSRGSQGSRGSSNSPSGDGGTKPGFFGFLGGFLGAKTSDSWSAGSSSRQQKLHEQQLLHLQQQSMAMAVRNFIPGSQGGLIAAGAGHTAAEGGGGGGQSGISAAVARSGAEGPRQATDAAHLLARVDALGSAHGGVRMSAHQRGLVQFILQRNDPFLTQQFGAAVANAERGDQQRLQELIALAEKLAVSMNHLASPLNQPSASQSPLSTSPFPPPPHQPLSTAGAPLPPEPSRSPGPGSYSVGGGGGATATLVETDAAAFAAAEAALEGHLPSLGGADTGSSSGSSSISTGGGGAEETGAASVQGQLELSVRAMEALALRKRAEAVDLRDAGAFEQALTAMRELKRAEALVAACKQKLDRAARFSV